MNEIIEILGKVEENENSAFFYTPYKYGLEKCYLFGKPSKTLVCDNQESIIDKLSEVDDLIKKYKYGYGYITYEAGYALEEKLFPLQQISDSKLLAFNFYEKKDVKIIPSEEITFKKSSSLLNLMTFAIKEIKLSQTKDEYEANINEIRRLISLGDTYQVNYTLKSKFNFEGSISLFAAALVFNQSAQYTAFINDPNQYIISISPELFFHKEGNNTVSKPMKGTIKRGINVNQDKILSNKLFYSKKDRAENIMIVDLLRNDIGKICEINSIKAEPLFQIEKYESLFQMTSTVSGKLKKSNFSSIIKNIFPCGSITGAPKIRTMEIIKNLEKQNRGIYTGTIGIIENENFSFNIPIRTITINKSDMKGEMGIGSGIVWDSNTSSEFEEATLKSHFLTKHVQYFEIIETMLNENGKIFLRDYH